jgi:tetratricopeptide (TPR) repeat protein
LAEAEKQVGVPQASANPALWIGRKVMPRKDATPQDEFGLPAYPAMPYVITRVAGDRLWMGQSSVARTEVVLLEDASRYYTEVLRTDLDCYFNRAIVWRTLGNFDQAIDDLSVLIRVRPTDALYLHNRGLVWNDKGELSKALADYDVVLRLEPNNAHCHVCRGNVRTKQGELDDALKSYDEAIRLESDFAWAYSSRGLTWSAKGDNAKALHDFDEAIRLAPEDSYVLNLRAWMLATCPEEKFRDGKQAVIDATLSNSISGWNDSGTLDTLAAAYAETGEFELAVKWQEKAMITSAPEFRAETESRLKLYRDRKPYREMPKR